MMFLPKITIIVVIWQFFLPLLALCYSTMENGEPSTYLSTYLFISVWTYELLVYLKGLMHFWSVAGGSVVKNLSSSVGDMGSIPGSGRSPGEGNGNPLQYSCLGNPTDREAWQKSMGSQRVGHDLVTKEQQQCIAIIVYFDPYIVPILS